MDTERIKERVKEIISIELEMKLDKVPLNLNFTEDFGVDPLDVLELIMVLGEEFNIEIPDGESETLVTVDDIVNYIADRVEKDVF